jgi:hypothetical protein
MSDFQPSSHGRTKYMLNHDYAVDRGHLDINVTIVSTTHVHRTDRFLRIIRGGVAVSLVVIAAANVVLDLGGINFSLPQQLIVGGVGVLLGAMLGAREAA